MKIAVTGHRPPKLGGYKAVRNFHILREHMKIEIVKHPEPILISGAALGIDQIWMEAGFELGIDVIAAIPFAGHDAKWPRESRTAQARLLARCKQVVYVCEPGYSPEKLQRRNIWMVDNSDLLVAYWNGSPSGTANCLEYATSKGHQVIIFNPEEIINV
jgi:uncharacterized phage-like protein YoqJ